MNTAHDIICYAESHDIHLFIKEGQLAVNAPRQALTDDFLTSAKKLKPELLMVLSAPERWNPELITEGYVWCTDCSHWGGTACTHPDNPFRQQCVHVPRKCQWYE